MSTHHELLNAAKATAISDLKLIAGTGCLHRSTVEPFVEKIIEASYQRMMLELSHERTKRQKEQTLSDLRDVVMDSISAGEIERNELKNVFEDAATMGERLSKLRHAEPGDVAVLEAQLFYDWRHRVALLAGASDSPDRALLIGDIHDSIAERHPLGIAGQLGLAIMALGEETVTGDDEAFEILGSLATDETKAAGLERSKAPAPKTPYYLRDLPDPPTGARDVKASTDRLENWFSRSSDGDLEEIANGECFTTMWIREEAKKHLARRKAAAK